MLYVFHVDTGTMLTFDMNLAMECVSRLQEVISARCQIPEDKQVLLISGGQSLSPTSRVCSYSAGTDTNPIFLFSKNTIEAASPPSGSINYGAEGDLNEQVEGSMSMQPSYETIVTRTQLALRFNDVAKEELKLCEKLVHDQHLQHQGWAAVIANLEDITSAFRTKWEGMKERIEHHLAKRDNHITILTSFPETVQLLSKIPLLTCLMPAFSISMTASSPTIHSVASISDADSDPRLPNTLLDWISAQESKSTLDQMAQQCLEGLNQFDEKVRDSLQTEVETLLETVNNPSMKEVKGLEDRLYGLEQLMFGAKKVVQEQADMAQGFVQNQNRARNLQDPSVLPDLCTSHKRQLVVMLKNHQNMRDVRRRCLRAKDELSENLHTRLRWVMYIEKTICDVHGKLVIYNQRLKKLQHCLSLILQMHNAPEIYCRAVVEVVRRKTFADHFIQWSGDLCRESKHLHDQEVVKRQVFNSAIKNHFLQALFPGFEEKPPAFATKIPDRFDESLPPIKQDDITFLQQEVPELSEKLTFPEESSAQQTFPEVLLETHGSSSRDSYSQTPRDFVELIEEIKEVTVEVKVDETDRPDHDVSAATTTEEGDSEDTVVVERLSVEGIITSDDQTDSNNVLILSSSPRADILVSARSQKASIPVSAQSLETSGITVSQSVEVVEELDFSEMSGAGGGVFNLNISPQPGITEGSSPSLQCPHIHKAHSATTIKDVVQAPPKHEKRVSKSSTGTSPDMDEASEGFTTADFYIDESMPSSLTESAGRKLAELQQVIQEKTSQLEHKDRELEEQRQSADQLLTKAQENFRLLHDVVQKGTLQLKCDVLTVEKQVNKDKDDFQSFMERVTKSLLETIARFEEQKSSLRDSQIDEMKQAHQLQLEEMETKLEVESQTLLDAHREIEVYDRKLKEKMDEIESLTQNFDKEKCELKENHESELKTAMNQMVLEQEVELEKVRSDFDLELVQREQEIQQLTENIDLKVKEITALNAARIKQEEDLTARFQTEKDEITKIIQNDFTEKSKQERETLREEIHQNFKKDIEELKKSSEEEKNKLKVDLEADKKLALEQLKADLTKELVLAVERARSEVELKKQQVIDKLRENTAELNNKLLTLTEASEAEKQQLQRTLEEERARVDKEIQAELERLARETRVEHETRETSPMVQLPGDEFLSKSCHHEEVAKVKATMEEEMAKVKVTMEEEMAKVKVTMEEEGKRAVEQACSELRQQNEREVAELTGRLGKEHETVLVDLSERLGTEKASALTELQQQHAAEIAELTERLSRENHDSLQELRNSITAEKQVKFNEALRKLMEDHQQEMDKQKVIETQLQAQLEAQKALSKEDKFTQSSSPTPESSQRAIQHELEQELAESRQTILRLESELSSLQASVYGPQGSPGLGLLGPGLAGMMGQSMAQSVIPVGDRFSALEETLKTKEEEVTRLNHKIGPDQPTLTYKCKNTEDLKRCNVNDLVLLCLDDQRANYVVFTVTNLLHFLHSDYLDILGLKTGPGEPKKSWVLAEVTDKEYCQAKKPQNRYNVPVGTKFYRIKAKPWSREVALQQHQQLHRQLPQQQQQQQQQQNSPPQQQPEQQQQQQCELTPLQSQSTSEQSPACDPKPASPPSQS